MKTGEVEMPEGDMKINDLQGVRAISLGWAGWGLDPGAGAVTRNRIGAEFDKKVRDRDKDIHRDR